tara:strand:- start:3468 stop:3662 length:195 start_codon:yes stop_codon:yes gene_type:complete
MGFFAIDIMSRFKKAKEKDIESFGILGFIFEVTALAKVFNLEKQIKESGNLLKKQNQIMIRFSK